MDVFQNMFYNFFFGTAFWQNSSERQHVRKLYLLSQIIVAVVELRKSKSRNLLRGISLGKTSSRALVKSHKAFWRLSEVLSSVALKPAISPKKESHDSYFQMTFEKIFHNTVLCQNTGKRTDRTEEFDFRSENFHKIHPKETMMKFFLS